MLIVFPCAMAAAMSKSMLVERLREAEDRLMTMRQEETMNALVQAKIKLAQADYANLELQVGLGFRVLGFRVFAVQTTRQLRQPGPPGEAHCRLGFILQGFRVLGPLSKAPT